MTLLYSFVVVGTLALAFVLVTRMWPVKQSCTPFWSLIDFRLSWNRSQRSRCPILEPSSAEVGANWFNVGQSWGLPDQSWPLVGWIGLEWGGMGRIRLDWVGLVWIGLGWVGLLWPRLDGEWKGAGMGKNGSICFRAKHALCSPCSHNDGRNHHWRNGCTKVNKPTRATVKYRSTQFKRSTQKTCSPKLLHNQPILNWGQNQPKFATYKYKYTWSIQMPWKWFIFLFGQAFLNVVATCAKHFGVSR